MRRTESRKPISIKLCGRYLRDVVAYTNFGDHRLRRFWVAGYHISPFPIDFHRTTVRVCDYLAHQHKTAGRKARLDIQNYGCNGNLLGDHGVVKIIIIIFLYFLPQVVKIPGVKNYKS